MAPRVQVDIDDMGELGVKSPMGTRPIDALSPGEVWSRRPDRMPYIKHPHLPGPGNTDDETQRLDDSARAERLAGQPHALLRVFRGVASDLLFRVDARGTTIGRASGPSSQVDIAVPDARMSREHVRIEFDGEGWSLTDQRSRNGAFVDGVQVIPERPTPIAHGSVIRTGDTLAVFVTDHLDEEDVADPTFYPGVSAAARRIRRRADVLARATGHVLVTGETGTGKERIARHLASRASAFVWVNCGELSRELARSELFGHVRAAYTGAPGREGLVASAGDGVLFLDEIGELGKDEQAMMLRAIEDKVFYPVGSDKEQKSDFQLIAGTNRDLGEEVEKGRFREDLFARINLWTFRLPSLAERPEDIEPNLDFELSASLVRTGQNVTISREARARFTSFATSPSALWTGNFRDFSAAITRMATLAQGGRIRTDVVEEEIQRLLRLWARGAARPQPAVDEVTRLLGEEKAAEIDRFDRVQLADVLGVCRSSKSLSDAGRALFAASRAKKTSVNDADRLRKYLARFGISWADLEHRTG